MPILALWPAQAQHTIQSGPGRRPMARLRRPPSGVDATGSTRKWRQSKPFPDDFSASLSVGADLPAGSTGSSVALLCIPVVAGADLGPSHSRGWYLALCLVASRWICVFAACAAREGSVLQ